MDDVIRGYVLSHGEVNTFDLRADPSGRQIWTGLRIRTSKGGTRFVKSVLVEAEAALIIAEAMQDGREIELWFTGKEARAYIYGIKSDTDTWYNDKYASHLMWRALQLTLFGLLTLPLLGIGVFFLIGSIGLWISSFTFSVHYPREIFERGYERGVLGRAAVAEAPASAVPA